jgi:hypothetical protein
MIEPKHVVARFYFYPVLLSILWIFTECLRVIIEEQVTTNMLKDFHLTLLQPNT